MMRLLVWAMFAAGLSVGVAITTWNIEWWWSWLAGYAIGCVMNVAFDRIVRSERVHWAPSNAEQRSFAEYLRRTP